MSIGHKILIAFGLQRTTSGDIALFTAWTLLVHIVVRACALLTLLGYNGCTIWYITRQWIYLTVWLILAGFCYNYQNYVSPGGANESSELYMEKTALGTMIACIVKLIVTFYFRQFVDPSFGWAVFVSNMCEYTVWVLLAVFLGRYWWQLRDSRLKRERHERHSHHHHHHHSEHHHYDHTRTAPAPDLAFHNAPDVHTEK